MTFIERENEKHKDEEQGENQPALPAKSERVPVDTKTMSFAFFVLFTLVVPPLVFFLVVERRYTVVDDPNSCLLNYSYRVPCGKINLNREECVKVGCCFDNAVCYHSIPARHMFTGCLQAELEGCNFYPLRAKTPFNNYSLKSLKLSVRQIDDSRVQIVLYNPQTPPISPNKKKVRTVQNPSYQVKWSNKALGVEVYRTTGEPLLTTYKGPTIASEKYWEWTFQLTSEELFGLGELLIPENKTITRVIYKNNMDHYSLPIFMARLNGSFHGVVVEHDGPLEVTVLPSRLVTLKSLAGDRISLILSTGPTPRDVFQQQKSNKTLPLPYWALGAHICRDGKTTLKAAIAEYKQFNYPKENENEIVFASDCIHENLYWMLNDVDNGQDLPGLIQDLRAQSHFLMSVPPQILKGDSLYNKAVELDLLYRNSTGAILSGIYLGEKVGYPDFTHGSISAWMEAFVESLPFTPDGFVLRDNWPQDDGYLYVNNSDRFPYFSEALNASMLETIPWDAVAPSNAQHMAKHNNYGASQAEAFQSNLKFEFLMTSSYDYGVPAAASVQNVNISWTNLKRMLTTTLFHSVFGSPLISTPVCGTTKFYHDNQEALCVRWYIMAATFPIFRISSDVPRRDPSSLATQFATKWTLDALRKRYALMPYYYTVLRGGEPLTRPMFFDFYHDNATFGMDEQYMVGKALLVAQPLLPDATRVRVYLPPSIDLWYEFWGGSAYRGTGWINVNMVETDWIMFIAEGHIVPMMDYKNAKIGVRDPEDGFKFAIALNCSGTCAAEGFLQLNTGNLSFIADSTGLTIKNIASAEKDLCGDDEERTWPNFVNSIRLYDNQSDEVIEYDLNPAKTLCGEDEVYIEYSQQP